MTITEALKEGVNRLNFISNSPRIDVELLLAKALNVSRAYLYTYPEKPLTETAQESFQTLLHQRMQGQPIAYLTETRDFWSMTLNVSPATLIPRPETELLVEKLLAYLPPDAPLKILDLGTGSGAIACALAKERAHWQIIACDISVEALAVAQQNARKLNIQTIQFIQSDWFNNIHETGFAAIVSNPPYLAKSDPHLNIGDVRFEPQHALISGPNGLESLQSIIEHSYNRLRPNGYLFLEHGFEQKMAVSALLSQRGYQDICCWQDYQGHDRVSTAKK